MLVLGIDCSVKQCSVRVLRDDVPIFARVDNTGAAHSQNLMPLVDSALNICRATPRDIELYAVTVGPGSFTGIRIGLGAVKGMAAVRNTPCVGVSSLKALASLETCPGVIIPALDARRRQVYACAIENGEIVLEEFCRDVGFLRTTVEKCPDKNIIFVGDGRDLCYNEFKYYANVRKSGLQMPCIALGACRLALASYRRGKAVNREDLAPSYLRLSQAERELREKEEDKK